MLYLVSHKYIHRIMLMKQKPCYVSLCPGGSKEAWTLFWTGNHLRSSESIIQGGLQGLMVLGVPCGSFLLEMQIWKVGLLETNVLVKFLSKLSGILSCVSREEFMEFTLRIVETSMLLMREKTLALGSPVYQHVFIFDMEGFSLKVNLINYFILFPYPCISFMWI